MSSSQQDSCARGDHRTYVGCLTKQLPPHIAKCTAPLAPLAPAPPARDKVHLTAPLSSVDVFLQDYGRKGSRGGKGDRRKGGKKYE